MALSPGSRALMERVGAWARLSAEAQPILEMAIFDGAPDDAVRFSRCDSGRAGGAPLARMAYNDDVTAALRARRESGRRAHRRRGRRLLRPGVSWPR